MALALDTVSDYVARARVLLQDQAETYRYPDLDLVAALNLAMLEARNHRADLFLGRSTPVYTANDATAVVMDEQYRVAFLYYIVGHAQMRDDESTQDVRAAQFLSQFKSQLLAL